MHCWHRLYFAFLHQSGSPNSGGPEIQAVAVHRLRTGSSDPKYHQSGRTRHRPSHADGQSWLGFEITGSEGQPIAPISAENGQAPLKIEAGQRVTHQINLTPLYPVHDFGTYHVRTNVYFVDLGKFFYSPTRVFEVTDARPIWQQTVGIPDGVGAPGKVRTYSLLTNRFPDHTSLYVRVQDKDSGIVYATYSLGRAIAFDEPQA